MTLIKTFGLIAVLFLLAGAGFSQTLLTAEITAIEKNLSDSKLSPAERKSSLEKMARLFELSGNAERAAEVWKQAALVIPASGHENLLNSARCFAAIGEFDRASGELRTILNTSDRSLSVRARMLNAQIEAFRSGNTGALASLLTNPDFSGQKPALYYAIWKISQDDSFAARLQREFPQSPEARIARNDEAVHAVPAALWFLSGYPAASQQAVPATAAPAGTGTMLQTGIFTREENARNMAEQLRRAGFTPVVTGKTVNGIAHWAAGVVPEADISQTMRLLKEKGFESFPVSL